MNRHEPVDVTTTFYVPEPRTITVLTDVPRCDAQALVDGWARYAKAHPSFFPHGAPVSHLLPAQAHP